MEQLDNDAIMIIIHYLDYYSWLNFRLTCRRINDISKYELYKYKYQRIKKVLDYILELYHEPMKFGTNHHKENSTVLQCHSCYEAYRMDKKYFVKCEYCQRVFCNNCVKSEDPVIFNHRYHAEAKGFNCSCEVCGLVTCRDCYKQLDAPAKRTGDPCGGGPYDVVHHTCWCAYQPPKPFYGNILELDDDILQCIMDKLGYIDWINFRSTCKRMHNLPTDKDKYERTKRCLEYILDLYQGPVTGVYAYHEGVKLRCNYCQRFHKTFIKSFTKCWYCQRIYCWWGCTKMVTDVDDGICDNCGIIVCHDCHNGLGIPYPKTFDYRNELTFCQYCHAL